MYVCLSQLVAAYVTPDTRSFVFFCLISSFFGYSGDHNRLECTFTFAYFDAMALAKVRGGREFFAQSVSQSFSQSVTFYLDQKLRDALRWVGRTFRVLKKSYCILTVYF